MDFIGFYTPFTSTHNFGEKSEVENFMLVNCLYVYINFLYYVDFQGRNVAEAESVNASKHDFSRGLEPRASVHMDKAYWISSICAEFYG